MTDGFHWFETLGRRGGPRYIAVVEALSEAIQRGELRPGDRVPTQRELAKLIGVTPGTTARAYAIAAKRGLIAGETGRGTFVTDAATVPGLFNRTRYLESLNGGEARPAGPTAEGASLGDLALPNVPESHLAGALKTSLQRVAATLHLDTGRYHPYGVDLPLQHREIGARWLAAMGVDAPADRILLTSGAHAALMIILFSPNLQDMPILSPAVTYTGLRNIATVYGRRIIPLQVDEEGVRPDSVEAACRRGMGQLLFLQTAVDNPTGIVMPLHRREALARVARRFDLIVIEDNAALIALEEAIPPIASLIPERTFLISSTAKCLAASLSLGVVLTPPGWANQIGTSIRTLHLYPSLLTIAVLEQLMNEGAVGEIWRKNKALVARRGRLAVELLGSRHFRASPGSHYGWLSLPDGWHAEAFTTAARHEGVAVAGSQNFTLPGAADAPEGIRLSLTGARSDDDLLAYLAVLKELMGMDGGEGAPAGG